MKSITVDIDPQGQVKIETSGFTGSACEKATAEIEKALGQKTSSKRKAEYYKAGNTNVSINAGGSRK
ncbi:MAG: DUF2997 domain-containing protein [Opitutaceae bacterium]|jgi:hypothetical protein|nr:DUF2997 domain-containing protein [Opitutaceae bacterium]